MSFADYLKQHWPAIREQLLNGTYKPQPVRRVEIRKPDGGGMRKLGIPPYMRGWRSYFGFCETPEVLVGLTRWVRVLTRRFELVTLTVLEQ